MCMQNLNSNVVFTNGGQLENSDLKLPTYHVKPSEKEEDTFILKKLGVIFSLNAIFKKSEGYGDNYFKLVSNYKCKLRLTSIDTGNYIDLLEKDLIPSKDYLDLNQFVYEQLFIIQFEDISIKTSTSLPEFETRDSKDMCVIKVLFLEDRPDNNGVWTVQSIHPFKIIKDS